MKFSCIDYKLLKDTDIRDFNVLHEIWQIVEWHEKADGSIRIELLRWHQLSKCNEVSIWDRRYMLPQCECHNAIYERRADGTFWYSEDSDEGVKNIVTDIGISLMLFFEMVNSVMCIYDTEFVDATAYDEGVCVSAVYSGYRCLNWMRLRDDKKSRG